MFNIDDGQRVRGPHYVPGFSRLILKVVGKSDFARWWQCNLWPRVLRSVFSRRAFRVRRLRTSICEGILEDDSSKHKMLIISIEGVFIQRVSSVCI